MEEVTIKIGDTQKIYPNVEKVFLQRYPTSMGLAEFTQGGSPTPPPVIDSIDFGKWTPEADTEGEAIWIPHNLGRVPSYIFIFANASGPITRASSSKNYWSYTFSYDGNIAYDEDEGKPIGNISGWGGFYKGASTITHNQKLTTDEYNTETAFQVPYYSSTTTTKYYYKGGQEYYWIAVGLPYSEE